MVRISYHSQPDTCARLWREHFGEESFFASWPARAAFQESFAREALFIRADGSRGRGLLPLAWIEEEGRYGYFPGETWKGRTWCEQNRIFADHPDVLKALLAAVPGPCELRYLRAEEQIGAGFSPAIDEINYSLQPAEFGFSREGYLAGWPGKSRKKILREVTALKAAGASFSLSQADALDELFRLNLEVFAERSYFYDQRFRNGFRRVTDWLTKSGQLRLVSVKVKGKLAAVDLVAAGRQEWTILAGGASPEFPGIAKVINLFHIEEACRLKIRHLDFLCGDFNWKERFRLKGRPLFQVSSDSCGRPPCPVSRGETRADLGYVN